MNRRAMAMSARAGGYPPVAIMHYKPAFLDRRPHGYR
jgi:hypothetical protein